MPFGSSVEAGEYVSSFAFYAEGNKYRVQQSINNESFTTTEHVIDEYVGILSLRGDPNVIGIEFVRHATCACVNIDTQSA